MSTDLHKSPLEELSEPVKFGEGNQTRSTRRAQGRRLHRKAKLTGRQRRGLWVRRVRNRQRKQAERAARRSVPGARGWACRGGGGVLLVDSPPEFVASNLQVSGFWPFSAGSGTPRVGVPLGSSLYTSTLFCADPLHYFLARLIKNPSAFILGLPGLGKSTLIRKMLVGLRAKGVIPLVLSDLRPDYTDLMTDRDLMGGDVVHVGPARDHMNPVDLGPLAARIHELPDEVKRADGSLERPRTEARADLEARRYNLVAGLFELNRGQKLLTHERNVLATALRLLDERDDEQVMHDLRELVESMPAQLAERAGCRGDAIAYAARTLALVDDIRAFEEGGEYGDVFAKKTTVALDYRRPASFDMSAVREASPTVQAGLQLVCWTFGSAQASIAQALSRHGLEPPRTYLVVMDELWLILSASIFMVDRINELSRLNRARMISQVLCTHTMKDLELGDTKATETAKGFVERAGMVFMGGLPPDELQDLKRVFRLSEKEQRMVQDWSLEGPINPSTKKVDNPPGQGNFLVKTGPKPGHPFHVALTPAERQVSNTNKEWENLQDSWVQRGQEAA